MVSDPSLRRRQALRALGLAGITGLAGCSVSTGGTNTNDKSGGNDGGGSKNGGGGDTGGTAQMASSAEGWGWNIAAKSLQLVAETYNDENDVNVKIEKMGGDSWEQRFQTAITSGTGAPDFSVIQNYDVTNYASIDGLADLTDRINQAGITDKIVDGKWGAVSYKDSYYAIPWDIGPTGVFYKRDRYDDAGIDPDTIETWDDFIEEGKKLPSDAAMINLPTQDMSGMWRMLFRQLGGQPFTKDGAINIHSEESVRVAQLIMDMHDSGITTRVDTWSANWFTAFGNGSIASLASAAWMDGTLREELPKTKGNWGVYRLPAFEKGGTRVSNRGGSNMAIPSQISDDATINRAWDYCLWAMTDPDAQNHILEKYGIFPSLKTAYDADIYDKKLDFYDGQPIFRLFADVATEIEPYRYTTDTPEVQDALETELGNMLDGKKSPKQAVTAAAKTVEDRTDRHLA